MKIFFKWQGLSLFFLLAPVWAQNNLEASACGNARDPVRCEMRNAALETCSSLRGADKNLCFETHMLPLDCGSAQNPARCERIHLAKATCSEKLGADQRRCMLEQVGPVAPAKAKAKRTGPTKKKSIKKPPVKKPAKPLLKPQTPARTSATVR